MTMPTSSRFRTIPQRMNALAERGEWAPHPHPVLDGDAWIIHHYGTHDELCHARTGYYLTYTLERALDRAERANAADARAARRALA